MILVCGWGKKGRGEEVDERRRACIMTYFFIPSAAYRACTFGISGKTRLHLKCSVRRKRMPYLAAFLEGLLGKDGLEHIACWDSDGKSHDSPCIIYNFWELILPSCFHQGLQGFTPDH